MFDLLLCLSCQRVQTGQSDGNHRTEKNERDLSLNRMQQVLWNILPQTQRNGEIGTAAVDEVEDVSYFRGHILVLLVSCWLELGVLRATHSAVSTFTEISLAQTLCMSMLVMEEVYNRVPSLRSLILQQAMSHVSVGTGIHIDSTSNAVVGMPMETDADELYHMQAGIKPSIRCLFFSCLVHRLCRGQMDDVISHADCVQQWVKCLCSHSSRCTNTVKWGINSLDHAADPLLAFDGMNCSSECVFSGHPRDCFWSELDRRQCGFLYRRAFRQSRSRSLFSTSSDYDIDPQTETTIIALGAFFPLLQHHTFGNFLISYLNAMLQQVLAPEFLKIVISHSFLCLLVQHAGCPSRVTLYIEILCCLLKHENLTDCDQQVCRCDLSSL